MKSNEHRFKKSLGQNFLNDKNVIDKIVSASEPAGEHVIEVGAGGGALTKPLAEKAKHLVAYEVDESLIADLKTLVPAAEILHQDFLKATFSSKEKVVVVGNLPYYITSEIIFKLFDNLPRIKRAVLMVQKEYAERMLAAPGASEYSKLSVVVNYVSSVKIITRVPRGAFYPVPGVDSVVLRLDFKSGFAPDPNFFKFIQTAFQMRRKTLVNNLRKEFGIEKVEAALLELKILLSARPQELSVDQFLALFAFLNNKQYNKSNEQSQF